MPAGPRLVWWNARLPVRRRTLDGRQTDVSLRGVKVGDIVETLPLV
jgi:hypothetical protein